MLIILCYYFPGSLAVSIGPCLDFEAVAVNSQEKIRTENVRLLKLISDKSFLSKEVLHIYAP